MYFIKSHTVVEKVLDYNVIQLPSDVESVK